MLQWDFNEKVGECVWDYVNEVTLNLYEGNAFLIFVNEFKEGEAEKYSVWAFFTNEQHMKNCLGLNKKCCDHNIFEGEIKLVRINKAKCRNYKKIVSLLAQGFDNIKIEIYNEV